MVLEGEQPLPAKFTARCKRESAIAISPSAPRSLCTAQRTQVQHSAICRKRAKTQAQNSYLNAVKVPDRYMLAGCVLIQAIGMTLPCPGGGSPLDASIASMRRSVYISWLFERPLCVSPMLSERVISGVVGAGVPVVTVEKKQNTSA